jgi:hypothetical protein
MLNIKITGYTLLAKGIALLVAVIVLTGCAQIGTSIVPTDESNQIGTSIVPTDESNQKLSTPGLIDQAYAKGEITADQRLLYLAYAIFEHESLPARFRSRIGWRATSTVEEIDEAIDSQVIFCSMSSEIRSEFQRLLKPVATCN